MEPNYGTLTQTPNKNNMSLNAKIKCTACSKGKNSKSMKDAEVLHPILGVPVCTACLMSFQQSEKQLQIIDMVSSTSSSSEIVSPLIQSSEINGDAKKANHNKSYCIWCGFGDGCELFLCDTCPFSFCSDCISRNFGINEMKKVRKLDIWCCYQCLPTPQMSALKAFADSLNESSKVIFGTSTIAYNSIDKVCNMKSGVQT